MFPHACTVRVRPGSSRIGFLLLAGLIVGGAIAIGFLLPSGPQEPGSPGGPDFDPTHRPLPSLLATPAQVDFGSVRPNQKVTREFTLKNTGVSSVRIDAIIPSCSCIDVQPSFPKLLAPGISLEVTATLTTPPFQDAPLRFDLMVSSGAKFKSLKVPASGRTSRVFRLEENRDAEGQLEGVTVRSIDDASFDVVQVPWFVVSDLNSLKGVDSTDLIIESERSKAIRMAADPQPTLALHHPTIGEVRMVWLEPDQVPQPMMPVAKPSEVAVSLALDSLQAGAEVTIDLEGLTADEAPFIDVRAEGIRQGTATLIDTTPYLGGVRVRVLVQSESDRWPGGSLLFTWMNHPACSVRLIESKPQDDQSSG